MAERSGKSDQRGPWMLALGAALVAMVAVLVEVARWVRRRMRD